MARTFLFLYGIAEGLSHATYDPRWRLAAEILIGLVAVFITIAYMKHIQLPNSYNGGMAGLYLFAMLFVDTTMVGETARVVVRILLLVPFGISGLVAWHLYTRMAASIVSCSKRNMSLRACFRLAVIAGGITWPCLIVDTVACNSPVVAYFELQALWHIGSSISLYLMICMAGGLSHKNDILWKWNRLPVLVLRWGSQPATAADYHRS
jgi:hypothetical protein